MQHLSESSHSRHPHAPLFIVIEGPDGVGTTTQAQRLAQHLDAWTEKHPAALQTHLTREPSDGEVGKMVRARLAPQKQKELTHDVPEAIALYRQHLALLFAADRLDHVLREVWPYQRQGAHVISDRYALSSCVYQSLDAPLAWVATLNAYAPKPDVLFVLEAPLAVCMQRIQARGLALDLFEVEEAQRQIHHQYHTLTRIADDGKTWAKHVFYIDAAKDIDAVTEQIWQNMQSVLQSIYAATSSEHE